MTIPSLSLTPVKTFDNPSGLRLEKTTKALIITQIALLALSITATVAFVIATAVTLNAYLLIGAGISSVVAFAILGRNLCCRALVKRDPTVFVPKNEGPYHEQPFLGFQTPMNKKNIPWGQQRAMPHAFLVDRRQIPGSR